MCWATPRSCDNSPIVRSAPGSFCPAIARSALRDPVAHDLAGAERHDPPRRDRHFDPGLGITPHALSLVAQDEGAEAGNLHILALRERVAHVMEHPLDDARRFRSRQAKLTMSDVGEIRTSQGAVGIRVVTDPRDP